MAANDKQIQVWATPVDHGPRVVFGARWEERGPSPWHFWLRETGTPPSTGDSIRDALAKWSADGEDRSWHEIEIVAAPAAIAAKHVNQNPAAWFYEQRWWWCNWGPNRGQIGAAASLRNVPRVCDKLHSAY